MNLQVIVAELKKERDQIDRAIAALDGLTTNNGVRGTKGRATVTRPKLRTGASLPLKLPERASPRPVRFQ
jgi:hypothetical protein